MLLFLCSHLGLLRLNGYAGSSYASFDAAEASEQRVIELGTVNKDMFVALLILSHSPSESANMSSALGRLLRPGGSLDFSFSTPLFRLKLVAGSVLAFEELLG